MRTRNVSIHNQQAVPRPLSGTETLSLLLTGRDLLGSVNISNGGD
jgi:hypothetical protein